MPYREDDQPTQSRLHLPEHYIGLWLIDKFSSIKAYVTNPGDEITDPRDVKDIEALNNAVSSRTVIDRMQNTPQNRNLPEY